jgi:hypothetical protein
MRLRLCWASALTLLAPQVYGTLIYKLLGDQ